MLVAEGLFDELRPIQPGGCRVGVGGGEHGGVDGFWVPVLTAG